MDPSLIHSDPATASARAVPPLLWAGFYSKSRAQLGFGGIGPCYLRPPNPATGRAA